MDSLPTFHKTFSGASIAILDGNVNAFIGLQTIDGVSIFREVLFSNFEVSGGTFYRSLIYQEYPN